MKRIVIDARESGTSTGRYLDKLIEYLHKIKPEHEFVLLAKEHRLDFLKEIAPNFIINTTPYKEFTFGEQLGFRKQISQLKPDLVFFPMVQQPVLYPGLVVTTMQDLTTLRFRNPAKNWLIFTVKREVYKWVNKRVAKKSKLLITPTEFVKQDVADYCHVDPKKITVTYESADKITDAPQAIKSLTGKRFLLAVGRPAANKNLWRLVEAFNKLSATQPELHLVFAGKFNAEYEKLQTRAKATAHGSRIIFTDYVSDAQLRWLYEQASVYVFPSLSEGFGLPGLEAMNYDLPVASSNATCLPEVYKNGALYFNPFSTADMANKIQKILNNPKLAKQLAQNGKRVVDTYSWKRMAEQTLAVFNKALL
jgi:glycosyltransferase involved in cell wall biosynthesis